jgi:actin-like protein 6A
LYKSAKSIPYAGSSVTKSIRELVTKSTGGPIPTRYSSKHEGFKTFQEDEILRDIKHSFSTRQTEDGVEDINTVSYELPDKRTIQIQKSEIENSLLSSEAESIKGQPFKGLGSMITDNINRCDIDIKKELYSNILLTGGNMLFGSTMQQVLGKVSELAPPNAKVKAVAMVVPQERVYSGWIGGSIVTSLSSFQSYWVGKEEWKEHGIAIV